MSQPSPRAPWQLGARWSRWFDRLLVGGLLVPVVALFITGELAWAVFSAAQIVPLLWRRSHPSAAFTTIALASALQVFVIDTPIWGQIAFPIALYSIARFDIAARSWAALGVGMAAAVVASVAWVLAFGSDAAAVFSYLLTMALIVLTSWMLGTLGRTRAAHVATLVDRAEQAERMAEREIDLAAQDERARIAREMHDVVAHGLSVIVVQADGARYAAEKDPDVAVATLETIGTTGREALTEMRRMLGLLRSGDSGVRPQPGLSDLPHLVEDARTAGMDLQASLPEDAAVSEGVGLAAYRIVQEALTNVRKHAGPDAAARLDVQVLAAAIEIEVRDDGRGAASHHDGRGLGLIGMRERASAHGGTLQAGSAAGGGFLVRARIPR